MINKIYNQEKEDFIIAKSIIEDLFGNKLLKLIPREEYSHTDMLFTACTRHYSTEIKMVYKDYYKTDGFILKFAKYLNAIGDSDSRDPEEGVFALYIAPNDRMWYIYNLREINLSECKFDVKKIKVVQYKDNSPKVDTPVIVLPTSDAILSGKY